MKAIEVLRLLNISRNTLSSYVKNHKVKVTLLDNGFYDYDAQSVFSIAKKDARRNYIYARVSTPKQAKDLDNQVNFIEEFCHNNEHSFDSVLTDISSGLDFDRKSFSFLFNEVINYRVDKIFISYKDRLTRHSFSLIDSVFKKFGTTIFIINKNEYTDSHGELFDEILSIMHSITTKMYSMRKY